MAKQIRDFGAGLLPALVVSMVGLGGVLAGASAAVAAPGEPIGVSLDEEVFTMSASPDEDAGDKPRAAKPGEGVRRLREAIERLRANGMDERADAVATACDRQTVTARACNARHARGERFIDGERREAARGGGELGAPDRAAGSREGR